MATVNLPDGTALNFPDGMSQDAMKSAIDGFLAQRQARPAGSPTPGGVVDAAGGMVNTSLAGLQKTSPVINERYGKPLGPVVADDSPMGYSVLGTHGYFDPKTQVILRDPATGKLMGYQRSPATDESALSGLGHVMSGSLTGPITTPMTASQRVIQAFRAAGVDPALGVLPSRTAKIMTSALRSTPGAAGPIATSESRMANQTGQAAQDLAAQYGVAGDAPRAGRTLQTGTQQFAGNKPLTPGLTPAETIAAPAATTSFGAKASALFDQVPIKGGDLVLPVRTAAAFQGLADKFPSSPTLGQIWSPDKFGASAAALQKAGTLTWQELKALRSEIGSRLRDPSLRADTSTADLKYLYGEMSKDMEDAATAAGPAALKAFQQANSFYAAGMKRIDDKLTAVFQAAAPEKAYGQLLSAAQEGKAGDIGKIYALQRSLPADDWKDVTSSVVRDLGNPSPGAVNLAPGAPGFSASTFVTNWSKMSPQAKDAMFGGPLNQLRRKLDTLASVSSYQKEMLRAGNTSGTAPAGIGAGMLAGAVSSPKATIATLGLGYATAKLMTWPPFVKLLTDFMSPSQLAGRALTSARLDDLISSAPPEARADMETFATKIRDVAGAAGQRGLSLLGR